MLKFAALAISQKAFYSRANIYTTTHPSSVFQILFFFFFCICFRVGFLVYQFRGIHQKKCCSLRCRLDRRFEADAEVDGGKAEFHIVTRYS